MDAQLKVLEQNRTDQQARVDTLGAKDHGETKRVPTGAIARAVEGSIGRTLVTLIPPGGSGNKI